MAVMFTEAVCPARMLNVFGLALMLLNAFKAMRLVALLLFFVPSFTVKLIVRVAVSGVMAVLL
ncbi:hypothetical protein D3C71_1420730 [compost metagenome]